ncbi:hypothetical protein V1478_018325 [Vespula squamosa]|uniref:Uncharacterized protein n=1 Tax=Vespula squamosa TaxID=30214 RepID=A0ABD1ZX45_VESSQ
MPPIVPPGKIDSIYTAFCPEPPGRDEIMDHMDHKVIKKDSPSYEGISFGYKLHLESWGSWNIARCNNDFTRKRVPPRGTHNEQELSIVCAKSKDVWSTIRCNLAEHHGATIIIEIRVKSDKSNVAVSFFLSSDFATNYN